MTVQRRCFNADQTHPAHLWQTATGEVFYCDPLVTAQQGEEAVKFTITLEGMIAVWARARNCPVTKQDCADLAEAIGIAQAQHSEAQVRALRIEVEAAREVREAAKNVLDMGSRPGLDALVALERAVYAPAALAGAADSQDGER